MKLEKRLFLSSSGFKDYLSNCGYTEKQIKKEIDPTNGNGVIGGLLESAMIEAMQNGWVVIEDVWHSSIMMSKNLIIERVKKNEI